MHIVCSGPVARLSVVVVDTDIVVAVGDKFAAVRQEQVPTS